MMVAAAPAYQTTVADLAIDAERIVALWRTGLRQNAMPEGKLDWYYRNNPEGAPLVIFLRQADTGETVGVASIGPRKIRFGARTLLAGALVDFVTQPEHRTFFPAMFLQREMRRRALDAYAIVFGFPNKNSLPIVRRVGYRCVGQMVRRTRVLRSSTYLAKYLPGWVSRLAGAAIDGCRWTALSLRGLVNTGYQSQWQPRPDAAFDGLWQRAAAPGVVMGVRDAAFLKWRFVDVQSKSFRFFTLTSSADGKLAAYAVCAAAGTALQVQDFLVDPAQPSAGARLWRDLALEAIRMGHASLSVELLGSNEQQVQLGAAGFLVREGRPVYASIAPGSGETAEWPTDASTWYMTEADDDW
ncbi:MAG: hypothetical protein ABI790_04530 [Betaproteobacteria bacterium]